MLVSTARFVFILHNELRVHVPVAISFAYENSSFMSYILNFCFKTTLRANENEFCLHENKYVGGIPRHKLENGLLKRDLPEKAL